MNTTKDTYILGISAFYHDSAACLIKNGTIIAAAQEERFTRIKHDASFPKKAIEYCLKETNITAKDLQHVVYYEKPFIKFERLLFSYMSFAPIGVMSFLKAMPIWLKQKLFLKDLIYQKLKEFKGDIVFPEHHESHAASAFFPSPYQEAAFLTMDGVGEWTTTSYGVAKNNTLNILGEIKFPHSLGLLYSAFTYYTGFQVNSGEYKMMGLAPYGRPKYIDFIKKYLIDIKDDGSFQLNMKYFNYCVGLTMTNKKFHTLFGGPPRKPETQITQKDMDIARSIQEITQEVMLKIANHVHQKTGQVNLCLAGGVALNCVGNGILLKNSRFKNIWIQPAAGDAGCALGAALYVWYQYLKNTRTVDGIHDLQSGTFLGPKFSTTEILEISKKNGSVYEEISDEGLTERIADLINQQMVIGLFQGRMEFGPRALGSRSIIADARSEKMQSLINLKIKFRESFRPFAPSVTREHTNEYFDLNVDSPYMLLVVPVSEQQLVKTQTDDESHKGIRERLNSISKRSSVPAITHVDHSSRVQTVSKDTNPMYHSIIKKFGELSGTPVIINTSFNIRGEPIVCTPQDAYRCFMCTDMDYLVMGRFIFDKAKQPDKNKYHKGRYPPNFRLTMNTEKKQLYIFGYGLALLIPFFIGLHTAKPFLNFWTFTFSLLGGITAVMTVTTKAANIKPAINIWMFILIEPIVIIAINNHADMLTYTFIFIANIILMITIIKVALLQPIYKILMHIAHILSNFITGLILILIYFVMFAIAGLFLRALRKDILGAQKKQGMSSFWIKREKKEFIKEHCLRQF